MGSIPIVSVKVVAIIFRHVKPFIKPFALYGRICIHYVPGGVALSPLCMCVCTCAAVPLPSACATAAPSPTHRQPDTMSAMVCTCHGCRVIASRCRACADHGWLTLL